MLNITVLYDPRVTRSLLAVKYHYIPLLATLLRLMGFDFEFVAYPAKQFNADCSIESTCIDNYIHNCINVLESNKTMKLAMLSCLTHCYFCAEMGFIESNRYHYVLGCIKKVKNDLALLLDCEFRKTKIMKNVYDRWLPIWKSFEPNGTSANRVVVLINGQQVELNILDTGLRTGLCNQLAGDEYTNICKDYSKMSSIQKIQIKEHQKIPVQRSSGLGSTVISSVKLSIGVLLITRIGIPT